MGFQQVGLAVLYVGGNDLSHANVVPQEICDNIREVVLQLQHDVAPAVYVFKVLQRCYSPEDTDAVRNTQIACLLSRKLTATFKRLPCVRTLNAEPSKLPLLPAKFMCRSFLPFKMSVETCTFSFSGFNAVRPAEAVSTMGFQQVGFAILYVGGNDLSHANVVPQEICDTIREVVLQLQHDVAPAVYVFKVLQRCYSPEDTDAVRNTQIACLLNHVRGDLHVYFSGFNAVRLAEAVSTMGFQQVGFAVLYVGGNDLSRANVVPQEFCDNIREVVLQLQHDVAPAVYVFKVLQRC
ncbi:hypothetical protein MTO96_030086 [Rhipicephalus appendiculatus]